MKALTFHGIEDVRCERVADPRLAEPGDAIVRVTHASICGSDLHVYHGRERGLDPGTVLGHEFVGEVVDIGPDVRGIVTGSRVACPFSTACGACFFCVRGLSARCEHGQLLGWVSHGAGLQGAQAEYVRVPLASTTLIPLPAGVPAEAGVLLGDVLATGFHCARGGEVHPDGVYVVIGCGPVGLMTVVAAKELGAGVVFAIDRVAERLARAEAFGATPLDATREDAIAIVRNATAGRGADAVLEAVGSESTARLGFDLVRAGGILSMVGVHTEPAIPVTPIEWYDKNLTMRLGRCPARSLMPSLLPLIERRGPELATIFTHTVTLEEGPAAYRTFAKREDGCVKVMLRPGVG